MNIAHQLLGLGMVALLTGQVRAVEDVTVHFGSPTGAGPVQILGSNGGLTAVSGLESIELLPIEFNGRAEFTRFLPSSPRLRDDVPGGRIVLPERRGSLYRYRRAVSPGFEYGFLWVDPQGLPHVVLELAGAGVDAALDPFIARVAIAVDGASFLVATTLAGGGDLIEVDLASANAELRTSNVGPLDFGPASLVLGDVFGVGVASTGVWRFDRSPGAVAAAVPLGSPAAPWLAREIARSERGQRVITIGGAGPNSAHVWVLGATGAATQASMSPGTLAGAGFLPDAANGPYLAVSEDGSLTAWKSADVTGEAWFRDALMAPTPVQLTADANFDDTLEEVGILTVAGARLVFGVGEAAAGGGAYDKVDLFQAVSSGGQFVLQNLTASSGQIQPPYTVVPTIEPGGMFYLPNSKGFVILDDGGSSNQLLATDGNGNVSVLLSAIKDLWLIEQVGPNLIVVVSRDLPGDPLEIHRFDAALNGVLLGSIPDVDSAVRPSLGDTDWLAFVTPIPVFGEFLWRVNATLGTFERLVPRQLIYGTSTAFVGGGELRLSVGGDLAPAQFVVWPTNPPPYRIGKASTTARLLPGD